MPGCLYRIINQSISCNCFIDNAMVSSNNIMPYLVSAIIVAMAGKFYYDNYCNFDPYPILDSSSLECRIIKWVLR